MGNTPSSEELFRKGSACEESKSYRKMKKYYKKAAENGYTSAMYNLAMHYKREQKYEKMIKYFMKAIEKKHVGAMNNLGIYYMEKQDFVNMEKYFNMAIEEGNEPTAMINMAKWHKDNNKLNQMKNLYSMAIAGCDSLDAMLGMAEYAKETDDMDNMEKYYMLAILKHDSNIASQKLYAYYKTIYITGAHLDSIHMDVHQKTSVMNKMAIYSAKINDTVDMEKYYFASISLSYSRFTTVHVIDYYAKQKIKDIFSREKFDNMHIDKKIISRAMYKINDFCRENSQYTKYAVQFRLIAYLLDATIIKITDYDTFYNNPDKILEFDNSIATEIFNRLGDHYKFVENYCKMEHCYQMAVYTGNCKKAIECLATYYDGSNAEPNYNSFVQENKVDRLRKILENIVSYYEEKKDDERIEYYAVIAHNECSPTRCSGVLCDIYKRKKMYDKFELCYRDVDPSISYITRMENLIEYYKSVNELTRVEKWCLMLMCFDANNNSVVWLANYYKEHPEVNVISTLQNLDEIKNNEHKNSIFERILLELSTQFAKNKDVMNEIRMILLAVYSFNSYVAITTMIKKYKLMKDYPNQFKYTVMALEHKKCLAKELYKVTINLHLANFYSHDIAYIAKDYLTPVHRAKLDSVLKFINFNKNQKETIECCVCYMDKPANTILCKCKVTEYCVDCMFKVRACPLCRTAFV